MKFVVLIWDKPEDVCFAVDENGNTLLFNTKQEAIKVMKRVKIPKYRIVGI